MTGRSCWCLELFRAPAADGAEHRRGRVQPSRARRAVARGGVDPRLALSRQRAAVRRRSAARRHEPRDARMAAADPAGARSADDDRGSIGRGDRTGAPRRAIGRACAGRRALPHRPRRPRHARAGIRGGRTAHRGRAVAPRAARSGAAGAAAGARRRPSGSRRGQAIDHQPAPVAAREPIARRSARRACRASSRPTPACACGVEIADVGPLPAEVESELFRIAGEALTNVRKHAGAREASLRLDSTRGRRASDRRRCRRRVPAAPRRASRVRPVRHRGSRPSRRRPRRDPKRSGTRHDGHRDGAEAPLVDGVAQT